MFHSIAIFSFALFWSTVNGFILCPFPGSTASTFFALASWQNGRSFRQGETVRYECVENGLFVEDVKYSLTCQSDGSWSDPLPVCGNLI